MLVEAGLPKKVLKKDIFSVEAGFPENVKNFPSKILHLVEKCFRSPVGLVGGECYADKGGTRNTPGIFCDCIVLQLQLCVFFIQRD